MERCLASSFAKRATRGARLACEADIEGMSRSRVVATEDKSRRPGSGPNGSAGRSALSHHNLASAVSAVDCPQAVREPRPTK
jgi:hypothetical protein